MTIYAFNEATGTQISAIAGGALAGNSTGILADLVTNATGQAENSNDFSVVGIFKDISNRSAIVVPANYGFSNEFAAPIICASAAGQGYAAFLGNPTGTAYSRITFRKDAAFLANVNFTTPLDVSVGPVTLDLRIESTSIICDVYQSAVLYETLTTTDASPLARTGAGFAINRDSGVVQVESWDDHYTEVNVAPVLDTPAPDFEIEEGQTWSYDSGANFSDANTSDTETYSISPNLAAVAGFAFDTATGTASANGTQVAAAGVSYTVTRTDSGGLTASDTFIITVVPPKLAIGVISDTTPVINTQITVDHSNAQGVLTTPNFNIASQTGTQFVLGIPDITTFILAGQTTPTINFNAPIAIPISDGVNSDNVDLLGVQPPAGSFFGEITSINPNGVYANDTGVVVGMFGYFFGATGNLTFFPESGVVLDDGNGGSYSYKLYNGEWGAAVTNTIEARPQGTVTIDSIVPAVTGAQIEVSYLGIDLTGYQYRLNGGAWVASTSSITLSGLTSATQYTFEVTAVNNGRIGDISTTTFTTQALTEGMEPIITLIGFSVTYVDQNGTFTDPGASVTSEVDGNSVIYAPETVSVATLGSTVLTYNYTDAAAQTAATVYRTVIVRDPSVVDAAILDQNAIIKQVIKQIINQIIN